MNIDKIKQRIKKLLAMAGDTSSPNEAAIAAERASKLMRQHQLDNADLVMEDLDDPDQLISVEAGKTYRRLPGWLQSLAISIAEATETQARISRLPNGYRRLRFEGYRPDVELAEWMLDYLFAQMGQQARAERKAQGKDPCLSYRHNSRKYMNSFRDGLSLGIRNKLAEFYADGRSEVSDTARGLVVAKESAIAREFGQARYGTRNAGSNRDGYESGVQASSRVNVSRGIGGSTAGPKLLGQG